MYFKLYEHSVPVRFDSVEDFKRKYRKEPFQIEDDAEPIPNLEEKIPNIISDVNFEDIKDMVMENYSGAMTYPGCKMVVRGIMDCDPPEPPEYDLPDEDLLHEEVLEEACDQVLKELGFKEGIQDITVNIDDRIYIEEMLESKYRLEGCYLSDADIIEKYARCPEEDY